MKTSLSYLAEADSVTILLEATGGKPPTLDGDVLSDLEACVARAKAERPRIVFLRSASKRFFCVGANIDVLKETDERTIVPWVREGHRVMNALEDLPMPVVAVVEGYAMGGGLELAMACDLIFASETAQLAQSEAALGFIPGWGGTRRLVARIGASKAKYWFYSGKLMDATTALEIGLVDCLAKPNELDRQVDEFMAMVVSNNRNAISQFKIILNDQERRAREENGEAESSRSVSCLQDDDTKQRLNAFLAKRNSK